MARDLWLHGLVSNIRVGYDYRRHAGFNLIVLHHLFSSLAVPEQVSGDAFTEVLVRELSNADIELYYRCTCSVAQWNQKAELN